MRTGAAQRSFFDQRDLQAFGAALNRGGNGARSQVEQGY